MRGGAGSDFLFFFCVSVCVFGWVFLGFVWVFFFFFLLVSCLMLGRGRVLGERFKLLTF